MLLIERLERFAVAKGSIDAFVQAKDAFDRMLVAEPERRSREELVLLEAMGVRRAG